VDAKINDSNKPGMKVITTECEEDLNSTDLEFIKKSLTECKDYDEVKSSAYPYSKLSRHA
jgi:dethiobiotin synthetase